MSNPINSLIPSNNLQSLPAPIKLLIVDSSEKDRSIYRNYIQGDSTTKYQIFEADNIQEALLIWRSQIPDMMLLDFNLLDGNGLDLLEIISSGIVEPKLPVIMLTGHEDGIVAANAIKLGATDYLIKAIVVTNNISL